MRRAPTCFFRICPKQFIGRAFRRESGEPPALQVCTEDNARIGRDGPRRVAASGTDDLFTSRLDKRRSFVKMACSRRTGCNNARGTLKDRSGMFAYGLGRPVSELHRQEKVVPCTFPVATPAQVRIRSAPWHSCHGIPVA